MRPVSVLTNLLLTVINDNALPTYQLQILHNHHSRLNGDTVAVLPIPPNTYSKFKRSKKLNQAAFTVST